MYKMTEKIFSFYIGTEKMKHGNNTWIDLFGGSGIKHVLLRPYRHPPLCSLCIYVLCCLQVPFKYSVPRALHVGASLFLSQTNQYFGNAS